jgi:hypothetical protein
MDNALEDLISRLAAEAKTLISKVEESENVGDAILISLPPEVAYRHGVQKLGRLTINEGRSQARFAPIVIDREPRYEIADRDMFSFASAFASGYRPEIPSYMFEECPEPVMLKEEKKGKPLLSLENKIFQSLRDQGYNNILVNPSHSTMSAGLSKNSYIKLTDKVDRHWKQSIDDFLSKAGTRLAVHAGQVGVSYLGSKTPEQYSGTWWYLIPDPYYQHKMDNLEFSEDDTGIVFSHTRKGRVVTSELRNDCSHYVYGSSTLGSNFGVEGFIMISSFKFPFKEREARNKHFSHTPWFLDDWPSPTMVDGQVIRCKGNVLYDVPGPGTYLSRRHRVNIDGFTWAPISNAGSFSFDRFSISPDYDQGVEKVNVEGQSYVLYGEKIVIEAPNHNYEDQTYTFSDGQVIQKKRFEPVTHVFVEDSSLSYVGLKRGYWYPMFSFDILGTRYILHEDIRCGRRGNVVVFKDATNRTSYYTQYFLMTTKWSRTGIGFMVDDNLVAAKVKSPIDNVMSILCEREELTVAQISRISQLTETQVQQSLTYLKRTVVLKSFEQGCRFYTPLSKIVNVSVLDHGEVVKWQDVLKQLQMEQQQDIDMPIDYELNAFLKQNYCHVKIEPGKIRVWYYG